MDQEERMIGNRLAWFRHYSHKSKNIAKTCRYFGISQSTYYFWFKRFTVYGKKGLKNRSRKPKNSPKMINLAWHKEVVKIRKKLRMGPLKISAYLLEKRGIYISSKTIHKILSQKGLNKLNKIKHFNP